MSIGLCCWILLLLWLVLGARGVWSKRDDLSGVGVSLIPFILFVLIAWHLFGAPIK